MPSIHFYSCNKGGQQQQQQKNNNIDYGSTQIVTHKTRRAHASFAPNKSPKIDVLLLESGKSFHPQSIMSCLWPVRYLSSVHTHICVCSETIHKTDGVIIIMVAVAVAAAAVAIQFLTTQHVNKFKHPNI